MFLIQQKILRRLGISRRWFGLNDIAYNPMAQVSNSKIFRSDFHPLFRNHKEGTASQENFVYHKRIVNLLDFGGNCLWRPTFRIKVTVIWQNLRKIDEFFLMSSSR